MQTPEQLKKTLELLQPQRLEGETYGVYKKRRRDMNKVIAAHIRGQALPHAEINHPMHAYHYQNR